MQAIFMLSIFTPAMPSGNFSFLSYSSLFPSSPPSPSVRLSAFDLIQSLCEEPSLSSHCYAAIISAMEKHLQEASRNHTPHWWKVDKTCM